jgi:hypothetical protein
MSYKTLSLLFFFLTFTTMVEAQFHTTSFWKRRSASLRFTTTAQSVFARNCSGVVTIGVYNANGTLTNVSTNTAITLSATASTTFYSDATCTTPVTSVTVNTGSNSKNFYFIDTAVEASELTAAATGYITASQTETISTNPFIWTGNGGDANWSTAGNWSGAAAPNSSQTALFTSSCVTNCSPLMNAHTSVGGVRIESGYAGTITQVAGITLTINSNNWVQFSGTFTGGNSTITLNSSLWLEGGTFTSTSGNLWASAPPPVVFSAGASFNHNNGTFAFNLNNSSTTLTIANSAVFNNLSFSTGCSSNVNVTGSMTVNGNLEFNSGCGIGMNGGTIYAKGNITTSNVGANGTLQIRVSGSTNQTITGSAGAANIPDLVIASTGGSVSLVNNLSPGNYTYVSGTLNTGTSGLYFNDADRLLTFTPGDANNYYSVTWSGSCRAGFALVGTLNLNSTLSIHGGCPAIVNGGIINARGDISIYSYGGLGSTQVFVNGSSNQAISGGGDTKATIPYLEIASTGGTVTFTNILSLTRGFKYTSGSVDATASNIYIMDDTSPNPVTPGSMEFNHITWYGGCHNNLSLTGTMIIKGNLAMGGGCPAVVNGGKLLVYGDASLTWVGGSTQLEFTGPAAATISGTGGTPTGNITVSKSPGIALTLANNISFNAAAQTFTLISGGVDMNGKAFTLKSLDLNGNTLIKNGGTLTVNGSVAGSGALYNGTVTP